jgi:hypothetical protein
MSFLQNTLCSKHFVASLQRLDPTLKRGITVTSSLNEISTDHLETGWWGGGISPPARPLFCTAGFWTDIYRRRDLFPSKTTWTVSDYCFIDPSLSANNSFSPALTAQLSSSDGILKLLRSSELKFLNSQFPIPPGCAAWRAGTTILFILSS